MSEQPPRPITRSPFLVALAAWIVPGGGYFLLRDYPRALTVGLTILLMFVFGLLVGGIRCLEVPGYDAHGRVLYSYYIEATQGDRRVLSPRLSTDPPKPGAYEAGWAFTKRPIEELRNKPWNIPQFLVGPLDLLADWWAVSVPNPTTLGEGNGSAVAYRSHSRVNELGVLYTAVAGLLNLLVIIDSAHRSVQKESV